MKKIFSIILCFLFLLVSFGFVDNGENIIDNTKYSHAVLNDGKAVTETFAVNFSNILQINSSTVDGLHDVLINEVEKLVAEFGHKISLETDLEKKEKLNNTVLCITEITEKTVCLKITYINYDTWKYFSNANNYSETVKRLYTYDYYDQKGKMGGLTNLGGEQQLIGEYLKGKVYNYLDLYQSDWKGDGSYLSSYTYITTLRRRHSTADSVIKGNDNLYFHQWLENDQTEILLWTTRPIIVSWYITAVVAALLVMAIAYILGRMLEKKKKNSPEVEKDEKQQISQDENAEKQPILQVEIENEKTDNE